jgi:hypothetical protein
MASLNKEQQPSKLPPLPFSTSIRPLTWTTDMNAIAVEQDKENAVAVAQW